MNASIVQHVVRERELETEVGLRDGNSQAFRDATEARIVCRIKLEGLRTLALQLNDQIEAQKQIASNSEDSLKKLQRHNSEVDVANRKLKEDREKKNDELNAAQNLTRTARENLELAERVRLVLVTRADKLK